MDKSFEPLKDGWFKPRETARYLIEHASTKYIIFLMSIFTIVNITIAMNGINTGSLEGDILWIALFIVAILAPLIGTILFVLFAFILWIVGKVVRGEGAFKGLFKAVIVAYIPVLLAFPFMLTWAILEPQSYLNEQLLTGAPIESIASMVFFVSGLWSFINIIITVSEAHRFSVWKALFAVLLSGILLMMLATFGVL